MDSTSKTISIVGTILGVGLLLFAVVNGLWAEPEKPVIEPTIDIKISEKTADTENVIELEVKTLVNEEIYSLAKIVQAEAGNQDFIGKQYVADVILNRVDSEDFPNTITEVINQPSQFYVLPNIEPTEEALLAAQTELIARQNTEVIYFRTNRYSDYGTPYQKIGDHYFSIK